MSFFEIRLFLSRLMLIIRTQKKGIPT